MNGCDTCGCQVRRTAYWDVNGMSVGVMTAGLRELNEEMGGDAYILNGGPLGINQPGAWYTIIGKPVCDCELVLFHRFVDGLPRHPRDCAVCNYHERDLRCLVDVGASDAAIVGHLRALRTHCRLEGLSE